MSTIHTRSANWINSWRDFLTDRPALDIINTEQSWTVPNASAEMIAKDEQFWDQVRSSFPNSQELINLNNGGVSSSPLVVEKAFTSFYSLVNSSPSYFTWKVMEPGKEIIREGLASLINCSKDEIAIFRNATEALNNVIFGIELNEGDEVVVCKQDYTKNISSWKQREIRNKIKIVWIEIDGTESNDEVIAKYVSAFSEKTKVINLTHVINWNGQVLPIEAIIKEAKKRNIQVLLDASHSFGILETDVFKLGCDYMATALHKWLSGPIPSGMLYVKKERIANLWPLASSANPQSDDVRKLEELSIQQMPNVLGLGYAIGFHLKLGRLVKEERVRYLRRHWTSQLKNIDGITFCTPLNENQCAVIANIAIQGWEPMELENELFKHNIHAVAIFWENMQGIRITPNIYTNPEDLDKLVIALKTIANTPVGKKSPNKLEVIS